MAVPRPSPAPSMGVAGGCETDSCSLCSGDNGEQVVVKLIITVSSQRRSRRFSPRGAWGAWRWPWAWASCSAVPARVSN